MTKGLFITLEGGDGSGKTTQLEFIRHYLTQRGEDVLFTREPGGTPIGEKIRAITADTRNRDMCTMTEALLFAASRAQLVEQVIRPALNRGKIVVCDRYIDSSMAYQGYGRGLGDSVAIINDFAIQGLLPDLTIFLEVDPKVGRQRRKDMLEDRLESEAAAFHDRVYQGYLTLKAQNPQRIVGIDGTAEVEQVSEAIAKALDAALRKKHGL